MSAGSITALVETLVAVGATPEQILAAVRTAEASKDDALERSREKARNRIKRWREKQPDVTLQNVSKRSVVDTKRLTCAEDSSDNLVSSGQKEIRSPAAPSKKGGRIPDDFQPDIEWAVSQGLTHSQAKTEAAQFTDYWRGKPGKDGLKLDWPGTWRMWVRNCLKRNPPKAASPPAPSRPRNAGELARMQLREMGQLPDAADNERRNLRTGDGGANPPITGLARRFAVTAGR